MILGLCSFLLLNLAIAIATGSSQEQFDEELTVWALGDGKVASSFSFKTVLRGAMPRDPATLGASDVSQHYSIFPLALGQILREYAVTELHLTLNAGNWNYERWGYPQELGAGTGGELWAWMGGSEHMSIDDRWQGLRNALSGLFCASLAGTDEQRTASPTLSFPPEGSLPNWRSQHQLRHTILPSERVCTENLTPFLKLLPCKSLSGIANLLNPQKIFDADWHGLGLHVTWLPHTGVEVRFSLLVVSDPVRSSASRKRDWSFASIFDRKVKNVCPIASSSRIRVAIPAEEGFTLTPEPLTKDIDFAVFELAQDILPIDITLEWVNSQPGHYIPGPKHGFHVQRTLRGSSQAHGQLRTTIKNTLSTEALVAYLEVMPWFVQFYLHTLHIHCDGLFRDDIIIHMIHTTPITHSRASTLQLILKLPPSSTVQVTLEVTKAFLRYTEHPPDAQRGWDLPPAVFIPIENGHTNISQNTLSGGYSQRVYTPTLLVQLATPDFSMPYNVIIFSCSLIAFIFGSLFNLLTRKFVVVKLVESNK